VCRAFSCPHDARKSIRSPVHPKGWGVDDPDSSAAEHGIRTIAALSAPMACSSARTQGRPGARLRRSKNGLIPFARNTEIDIGRVTGVHARVADKYVVGRVRHDCPPNYIRLVLSTTRPIFIREPK
jgi:hypothetical protein